MQDGTLHLRLKDGAAYDWEGATKVREAKAEVRWTNARGEKRSMALAFVARWWVSAPDGLFEPPSLTEELHACDLCPAVAMASRDVLRVAGWVVFDGKSETGKDLHVRLCRNCQKGKDQ